MMLPELNSERQRLLRWGEAALAAVDPVSCTARAVARLGAIPTAVLAIGKAAPGMAEAALQALGSHLVRGLMIAPELPSVPPPGNWTLRKGNHPLPGHDSLVAGKVLREWLDDLEPGLPLLVLLSGGGSALVELPVDGMDTNDLAALNRWLLASGFDIHRMNAIRARFSKLKRGGLLQLAGERDVTGLLVSDVPGDRVASIASGPLSPGDADWPDVPLPAWLRELHDTLPLSAGLSGRKAELRVIARNADALDAIESAAAEEGVPLVFRGELRGDAVECARRIAGKMRAGPSGVYLLGGETTVALPASSGRGGRNQHLALAAALQLEDAAPACLLALASDGVDGDSEDAGGLVDNGTARRIRDAGLSPETCLENADSGAALEASGDIVHLGPTGTNVADVVIGFKP